MNDLLDFVATHPWVGTSAAALAAVMAAMAVHRIGRTVLRRVTRGSETMSTVLNAVDSPAAAALPLVALLVIWEAAPNTLTLLSGVRHGTVLLLTAALTWLAVKAIAGFAQSVVDRHPATGEDNLEARRIQTMSRVLARSAIVIVIIGGCATALMSFPGARQVGASLLASAGVLGIVAGLAARPVFSNLIAGLQIAVAQPIRIDDVLIVKGEWGRVEEITGSFVVMRIWDERRLVIPLQWFIENPFENWTRRSSQILGTAFFHFDYTMPVDAIRAQVKRIVEAASEWDGRVCGVQVTDITERTMQVRVLVSAANAGLAFDLRCKVREGVLAFAAQEYPQCLPLLRGGPAGAQDVANDGLAARSK